VTSRGYHTHGFCLGNAFNVPRSKPSLELEHPIPVRYALTILALVVVVGGLGGIKYKQIASLISMGKEMEKAGPPPEAVGSAVAKDEAWEGTLNAVGSIAPVQGVALSNESPGVVSRIFFDSGDVVKQGQVLVELDSSVERAQLASSAARLDLAKINASRSQALVGSGAITRSQFDSDDATLKTSSKDVSALQAQIDRKVVRAPFAGRLGIRAVNLGQYLNPGTQVTVLEALDSVYVDFTLPQQQLSAVKTGMPVHVVIEGAERTTHEGVIVAIDPELDSMTRSIKLRASVPNKEEKLRPGMFANVAVVLPPQPARVTIPATAIVHAAYGDSVFVIEDKDIDGKVTKVARQQFVRVGESRGDFVAVLDGVTAGETVVSVGAFKLRNGSRVTIDNTIKPSPSMDPHPENR
jgi:membrane fusion protein (multidrug efflux system)